MTTSLGGVDYGPLAPLIGTWRGDKGVDVAPEPDGEAHSTYYETILFEAAGEVTNAERQTLSIVRYHQVVTRKSDDKVFHNETGYWLWDAEQATVMQTLTIPRGVSLVAGGSVDDAGIITVRAGLNDPDWPVAQSPFLRDAASTVAFVHNIAVAADTLRYDEITTVEIYGKVFEHTDQNELIRA